MAATEFTTTIAKSVPIRIVRDAVNSEKYDEYRQLWDDALILN